MFKWLKRHFVPHAQNNHRPHFLHSENTRWIIAIILATELLVFVLPVINFSNLAEKTNLGAVLSSVLTTLTNEERQELNLGTLEINPLLTEAARLKAEDMATKGYFAHTSPEGRAPWYWLEKAGYPYLYGGENLAINFIDSKDVTEAWMNSPTHRANILKTNYTEVGTGIATGIYQGRETVFVAQFYGSPKTATSVASTEVHVIPPTEVADPVAEFVDMNPQENPVSVLGTETKDESTVLAKVITSPRHTANVIMMVIGGIILATLLLNILIKTEVQHPDLITNGLIVLILVFGIYLVNSYISQEKAMQISFTDFESEQVSLEP